MPNLQILLFSLLVITNCAAQRPANSSFESSKEQLLNNPDITWVGEAQTNLRFQDIPPREIQNWNELTIQKLLLMPESHGFAYRTNQHNSAFQLLLFEWMKNAASFADRELTKPIPINERKKFLSVYDTTVTLRPDSTERLRIRSKEIGDWSILGVRVHQLVYWDATANNFGSRSLSFTPLVTGYHNSSPRSSNLWFPIDVAENPRTNWQNTDVSYVAETRHLLPFAGSNAIPTRKGQAIMKDFLLPYRDDENIELRTVNNPNHFLNSDERDGLFRDGLDTVIIMDINAYTDEFEIVDLPFHWDRIWQFQLVNRWFWDTKNFRLSHEFVGWGPLLDKYFPRGGGLHQSVRLFFRKAD